MDLHSDGDHLVTKPSGTAVAGDPVGTHTLDGVEVQTVLPLAADGHIVDSKDLFVLAIPSQVHVAVANTVHWDLFNADAAKILRVLSIRQKPNIVTAVTGVAKAWKLARTTAVGTGGSALTPWPVDTTQAALDADITARSKPTGGATEGTILRNYDVHSEETNTGTLAIAAAGGLELVPEILVPRGIVLRQNEGLRVVQITSSAAGNTGWDIVFSVE